MYRKKPLSLLPLKCLSGSTFLQESQIKDNSLTLIKSFIWKYRWDVLIVVWPYAMLLSENYQRYERVASYYFLLHKYLFCSTLKWNVDFMHNCGQCMGNYFTEMKMICLRPFSSCSKMFQHVIFDVLKSLWQLLKNVSTCHFNVYYDWPKRFKNCRLANLCFCKMAAKVSILQFCKLWITDLYLSGLGSPYPLSLVNL